MKWDAIVCGALELVCACYGAIEIIVVIFIMMLMCMHWYKPRICLCQLRSIEIAVVLLDLGSF